MTHNRAMTDESDSRRVSDQSPQQPEVLLPSAGVSGSLEEQRSAHVQWSQFLETSPDPMWIKDPAGRYLTVNQAFFDYLSFRREEVLDHTDWEIYPAEIASRFQDEDRRVMEEGSLYYEDSEIRDGHESHFLIRKRRIVGEDGRIAGILGLATDVTERKRMKEELHQRTRQALHLQKALLELSKLDPSVTQVSLAKILEVDAHALQVERVSYWSLGLEGLPDTCEDQYTKSRGEHEWGEVMYLSHYPDYFRHLTEDRAVVADDAQQDPATCEFTEWFLRPHGITSLLDVPVRRQGRIIGVVCHEHIGPPRRWTVEEEEFAASVADQVSLLLETAERQAAEEAQRLSEERFRLALESASEGLWDWDVPSGQAYFGPRYYTMLGYQPDSFPASYESFESLLHPDDLIPTRQALSAALGNRSSSYQIEFRFRAADGSYRWILSRGHVVSRDGEGRPRRMLGTHIDITERKRVEEEARKARTDLLYAVSHELKTPLMTMLQTQELLRDLPAKEKMARFSAYDEVWRRNLLRLRRMIDNLVDSQRTNETGVPLQKASCRFQDLIIAASQNLAAYAEALGVQVEIRFLEELPPLLLDMEAIDRVIDNLLSNAIKFSQKGGQVDLELRREGEWAILIVRDQGCGIAKEEQERLFQPFQRARQADRKVIPGTGLGLYVARQMVEAHGGTLSLESEIGCGTTATVRLPL